MVYKDVKSIPSFYEDTNDFRNRIAYEFKTLPYLMSEINDNKVILLEEFIKEYKGTFENFIKWLKQNKFPDLRLEFIVKLWIFYKKEDASEEHLEFINFKKFLESSDLSIFKDSKNFLKDFDIVEFSKQKNFKQLEKLKIDFNKKVERIESIYKKIEKTKESTSTIFKKNNFTCYYKTTITGVSLDYIFNLIKCNVKIQFCSLNIPDKQSVCKIYENFKVNGTTCEFGECKDSIIGSKYCIKHDDFLKKWNLRYPSNILLKIENNINCMFFLEEERLHFIISFDTITFEIKDYIGDIFTIPIVIEKIDKEDDICGVCYFPNQLFNKYILSDLIMNDPNVSKFICVDESQFTGTLKSYLLLKFKGSEKCHLFLSKKVTGKEKFLRDYEEPEFKINSYYSEIRLFNFKSIEQVDLFKSLISKFFTIYHEREQSIFREYEKFFSKGEFILKDVSEEKEESSKLSPDFGPGYKRMCKIDRKPSIIHESKLGTMQEYKDYIRFPKEEEGKQFCYYCKHEKYPFIGLMENTNADTQHDFVPCCFQKENKNVNVYYLDEEKKTKTPTNYIIQTLHRLLKEDTFGTISPTLELFLYNFYDKRHKFYRKGVEDGKHSFLSCIKMATKKREKIDRFEVASQENTDLTIEEMKQLFTDKDTYLDPRRWIRLLEYFYKCNIYVFIGNVNSKLMIPFHKGPYLQYKKMYEKNVIIIEHDKKVCELVLMEIDGEKKYIFEGDFSLHLTQFYLTPRKKPLIKFVNYPSNLETYSYQILDSYKKTRCLVTSQDVFLDCDPIPPLNLPLYKRKPNKEENQLEVFRKNRKIASILGEIFIYMFSRFAYFKKTLNTIELIRDFIKENVMILKTFYKILDSSIINSESFEKAGYIKSDKLIVSDENTLKRLICLLRLRIVNNFSQIVEYHKRKELLHFYDHISDYSSQSNIICYTTDICKLQYFSNIVFREFQSFSKYYICFDGKLFLSEIIKKLPDDSNIYLMIYNQKLQLIRTVGEDKNKNIRVIEYTENFYKKFQQLQLL